MNNKTLLRPPTLYIFHGPPPNHCCKTCTKVIKDMGSHKNQYNPSSQNHPEPQIFQVLKHMHWFCPGKQDLSTTNLDFPLPTRNLQGTQGILGTTTARWVEGGFPGWPPNAKCQNLFLMKTIPQKLHLQKCNLYFGRSYLLNVILPFSGPKFQRDLPKCKYIFEGTDFMGFWENVSDIFEGFTCPKCKVHLAEVRPLKR